MTSQYDIEMGISKGKALQREYDKLENKDTKKAKKMRKELTEMEKKVYQWCVEFDAKIKPLETLPECPNPEKIFVARMPMNIKDHMQHVKDYAGFINKEGYDVFGIDKQKGYLTIVYCFFCKKFNKSVAKPELEKLLK